MISIRNDVFLRCFLLVTVVEGFVSIGRATNVNSNVAIITSPVAPLKPLQRLLSQVDDNETPMVSLVQDDKQHDQLSDLVSEESHIPTTGISVGDEMDAAQSDQFVTDVVPIEGLTGVAQLVTTPSMQYSFEPVRYLVALDPPRSSSTTDAESTANNDGDQQSSPVIYENATFALVDVPPFSQQLVERLKDFMGINPKLVAILTTSSDAIHFDEAPTQMYAANRRAALLSKWKESFPEANIIACRLDTPRDCQPIVSQKLDGMGPFGWDEQDQQFLEMGQPLQLVEWDHTTSQQVMNGEKSPDVAEESMAESQTDGNDDSYSPSAIRDREEGRRILAVCTPGHSYGSVSFVFPETKVCCSGYTIPVEDTRAEENLGYLGAGPFLDARGYITNSQAGVTRQMESARRLVTSYVDRFSTILPSRGDPLMLDGNTKEDQKEIVMGIIDQYDKIGQIYEQLGITSSSKTSEDAG
eukprot:CAMPEP_0168747912 /NCGR_PEP_ID=MMETSP0724-20121128/15902_1 /TAXON_ID=265536 /ORGANISM="Amphiprora sp., Strain CCMP467" /LENGTH=469 /DNA_ID=CAMNT_0008795719 /DNA_START=16 /DNA_END=1425 /DNA_ORIENTATION=-